MNQRGSIGVYLLFSIVVATAAGYGVYALLRARPQDAGDAEVTQARAEPHAVMPVRPAPPPPEPPEVIPEDGGPAERGAIAPAGIEAPDEDTVLLGTPGVAGALEPAQVDRTMKRYMVRWERCMRRARERDELPDGVLSLSFVIAGDGSVSGMSYRASVEDSLAVCVTDVVKKLRFDKPVDGADVRVVVPMRFVPARDGSDPLAR